MAIAARKREGCAKRVRWSLPSFRRSHWDVVGSKKCHQDLLWSFCLSSFRIVSALPLSGSKVLQMGQVQVQHRVMSGLMTWVTLQGSLVSKVWLHHQV